ncbi:hypothetical protein DAI22_04g227550 [Oryza sativa Japonica Group]|nr:hypothetical protein DAI22_04g227550 [Oryza sativa Japonica Group]
MEESKSGQPAMDATRSDPSPRSCGSCSRSCGLLHMSPCNQYAAAYGAASRRPWMKTSPRENGGRGYALPRRGSTTPRASRFKC